MDDRSRTLGLSPFLPTRLIAPEVTNVNELWLWDFHHGSCKVLTTGGWRRPSLFAILDDRSEFVCHAQWYLEESAENVVHALMEAMLRYGLPVSTMSDNGFVVKSSEIVNGFAELGIVHKTTLPYRPWQIAKQEHLWRKIEDRLLPLLEDIPDLSLALLNETTQVWLEHEHNCGHPSEAPRTPIKRFTTGPNVSRPCPETEKLRLAFTRAEKRRVRKVDGSIRIGGMRFNIPEEYRDRMTVEVRYVAWNWSFVQMIDKETGSVLCRLLPE